MKELKDYKNIAIVFSGGGAKGAFQVGAERVLRQEYGMKWSVVSGQSVGSLNGALIAMREYQKLEELWLGLKRSDVFKKLTLRRLFGVVFRRRLGLMSNMPLFDKLRAINPQPEDVVVPFRYGAVDLKRSCYIQFTEDDLSPETLLASASIPIVFPPVGDLVDGGLINNGPIGDILGFKPDLVVVIPTKEINTFKQNETPKNILQKMAQIIHIVLDEGFRNDFAAFLHTNRIIEQVNEYNKTLPKKVAPFVPTNQKGRPYNHFDLLVVEPWDIKGGPLDFSQENIVHNIEHGEVAAREAIKAFIK